MQTNKAIEIADKFAGFLQPVPGADEGLIRAAMEYTLQLTPDQMRCLSNLEMIANDDRVPKNTRDALLKFLTNYERRKRYHDSGYLVSEFISSLSWRRFVQSGNIQGSVNKNSNSV